MLDDGSFSIQQAEQVMKLGFIRSRRKMIWILMVFAVCLFGGCGQAAESGREDTGAREKSGMETESGVEEESETREEATRHTNPMDNDTLRDSIYRYYGRDAHEKISKEEIEAVKGKLWANSVTIHDGEEFARLREWYNWDNVHSVIVYFSRDLQEWQEEDLLALKILHESVQVESDSGTFPVRALTYLTGAQEVYFSVDTDVTDVTGTLSEGEVFPRQIKSVALYDYREEKYHTLLGVLQDSRVEMLTVRPDWEAEDYQGFWLDEAAQIGTLKELVLNEVSIQVREEAALKGSVLVRIEGCIDQDTDLCFVKELGQLEELNGCIVAERDLSPLLHRKGLSLYLDFCRQTTASEEEAYGSTTYTVCPEFNKAVSWPGESGDEGFLGIYQRREEGDLVAECFTKKWISRETDEIYMYSFDPWIRVTAGASVYELSPGEEDGEFCFGDARSDRMRFEDINFDGVKDIVLEAGHFGSQGLLCEFGYLWDQASGRYVFSPTYSMISNPSIDSEHQLVRSSWRNWAASHSWAIYRYVDGKFVVQGILTEEPLDEDDIPPELEVPEGAEVWRWREEIMEDGKVVEVRNSYAVSVEGEETVYPEAYESYYAEDSYWG